jgi:hypothetical protein
MNWHYLTHAAWHGFSASVITGGGIVVALAHWPTKVEWLVIGVSAAMAFVKGVDGFSMDPEDKA